MGHNALLRITTRPHVMQQHLCMQGIKTPSLGAAMHTAQSGRAASPALVSALGAGTAAGDAARCISALGAGIASDAAWRTRET